MKHATKVKRNSLGLAIIGIGWIGIAFIFARLDGEAKSLNHDLSTTVFGKINLIAGSGISVSFTTAASIAGFIGLAFLIIAFCLYRSRHRGNSRGAEPGAASNP